MFFVKLNLISYKKRTSIREFSLRLDPDPVKKLSGYTTLNQSTYTVLN